MPRRSPAAGLWPERRERETRSSCPPIDPEPFDPDREADGGNGVSGAEARHQPVIASAGDKRVASAFRIGQLEDQPRIVIEAAAEGGRELQPFDVDAACFEET